MEGQPMVMDIRSGDNDNDSIELLIAQHTILETILGAARTMNNECRIRMNHEIEEEIVGETG